MPRADRVQRVFHVQLKVEIDGYPEDTYFFSKKALFNYWGKLLGISYGYARAINFAETPYENTRCVIKEGIIIAAKRPEGGSPLTDELNEKFKKNNPCNSVMLLHIIFSCGGSWLVISRLPLFLCPKCITFALCDIFMPYYSLSSLCLLQAVHHC